MKTFKEITLFLSIFFICINLNASDSYTMTIF